ncbi:MAG: hypothetical protein WC657_02630 [Candidatus Paceibacterota bacterium]|jgi:hypothetical protein
MTAQQVVEQQVAGWGEREIYLVTEEEFEVLLSSGGSILESNRANGDGTFFKSLSFQGRVFCTSTTDGGVL